MTDDVIEFYAGQARHTIRGGHEWFRFVDHDVRTDEALVEIYDEIGYYGITAADFTAALAALPKSTKTINLRINSPGGSVFEGLTVASRLRDHSARVNVTVDGVAASIASVVAMAGDQVAMARGSQMMIHNPSGLVLGGSKDMRDFADVLDKLARDSIASAYMGKAGGSAEDWLARMEAETWLAPSDALGLGLADVADVPERPEDRKAFDLAAYGFRYSGRGQAPDPAAEDRTRRSRAALARIKGLREERK